MATELDVGGYTSSKTIEGQQVNVHAGTVRLRTTDQLDVIATGNGSKTVLQLVQEAVAVLEAASTPGEPPAEWTELLRVPADGTEVVISLGVRSEYKENA